MGLAIGEMIVMRVFGSEGMKAVIADIGFTIMIGSVGYEARHVSDPCIVSFSRVRFFEEEEIYVVLAFFVGGEVLYGKGDFRVSRIDGVQIN